MGLEAYDPLRSDHDIVLHAGGQIKSIPGLEADIGTTVRQIERDGACEHIDDLMISVGMGRVAVTGPV